MKKNILILVCIVGMIGCQQANSQKAQEKPIVYALDGNILAANKARVASGDASLKPAYLKLLRDANDAMLFGPVSVMEKTTVPPSGDKHDYMSLAPYHWPDPAKADGLPYIRKDGQTNPEVKNYKDKEYLPALCESVYALSMAYYFSGDKKYADKASKLIRVWFLDTATKMNPNLNYGQAIKGVVAGRGAGLIDTRHLVKVVDAIGLLQGATSWSLKDQEGMKAWFSSFLDWMQTSKNGMDEMDAKNNHGVWYDAQRLSFALFTGQKDLAEKIVANAKVRLDYQMDNDGFFPAELARTISLHYSVFVVDPFFTIAQMATNLNIDLWNYKSPSGKSLSKGFKALQPYLLQEKKWEGQQIKPFNFKDCIPVLAFGNAHYDCLNCLDAIKNIAGDDFEKLRIHLVM
jgi:Alginate lyase